MASADAGDDATLLSLFAKDATLTSDGGGVVPAARKVIHGRARIARLYLILFTGLLIAHGLSFGLLFYERYVTANSMMLSNLERDGHSSTRKPENDDVASTAVMRERLSETAAGIATVGKTRAPE